jgi:type II secretory pathway component PulF
LSDALEEEKDYVPPLFLALVQVGESTGHLAEIFGELERYYELERQLRRQFRSQTFMPVLQFFGAILVFAGLLYILGAINPNKPLLTFFGLGGAAGSLAFLGAAGGVVAAVVLVYWALMRFGQQRVWFDGVLLRIPVLGRCLRALAMSRLTLALQLTLDTGLSITRAVRLGLNATGNAYFSARANGVVAALKGGGPLHDALVDSGLFAEDFLGMVASAEVSGRLPEMMRHLAVQYHDEAARRMKTLTMLAGLGVWGSYAAFMIFLIFRIANVYFDSLRGV